MMTSRISPHHLTMLIIADPVTFELHLFGKPRVFLRAPPGGQGMPIDLLLTQ